MRDEAGIEGLKRRELHFVVGRLVETLASAIQQAAKEQQHTKSSSVNSSPSDSATGVHTPPFLPQHWAYLSFAGTKHSFAPAPPSLVAAGSLPEVITQLFFL